MKLDSITMTPRQIMKDILAIQSIELDPSINKTERTFDTIANLIGSSDSSDGITTFDCYICYREASNAFLADKLYVYLKSVGIKPFMSKKTATIGKNYLDTFQSTLSSKY